LSRALILGGGGFLGGEVARWLAARGTRLRIFDLRLPQVLKLSGPGVDYVEGNFLNGKDLDAALDGVDQVLHFISTTVPASSMANVPMEIDTNLSGTVRLLDLMVKRGVRRIGFPSSGGTVYGASEVAHREDEAPRPTCPYGLGKVLIENVLRYYLEQHGIEFQIWRLANPYGDAAKVHLAQGAVDAFLQRVHAGQPLSIWGEGSAVRDFVFADDVAAAVGLLLEKGAWNQVVNIGGGVGASILEVVEIVSEVAGVPVQVNRLGGYTGPARAVLDSGKLRALTGWAPVWDLRAGIAEAWRRLRAAHGG
jgi:UDP-glucose 4-epimerase